MGEKGDVVLLSSCWFCIRRFTWQQSCTCGKKGALILVDQEMHQCDVLGFCISAMGWYFFFFCISLMKSDCLNHINDGFNPSPHHEEGGWGKGLCFQALSRPMI